MKVRNFSIVWVTMNSKGKIPIADYFFFCLVGSSQKLYIHLLSCPNGSDTKLYSSAFHGEKSTSKTFSFIKLQTRTLVFTCIKNRTLMSM